MHVVESVDLEFAMSVAHVKNYRSSLYQLAMNFEFTSTMWGKSSLHICTLGYQNHTFVVLAMMLPLHQEVVLSWDRDMRGPQATFPHGSQ
jgi:hypothetical protein